MEEEEELETREAWQDSISETGLETREEPLGILAEQDTLGSSESESEGEGEGEAWRITRVAKETLLNFKQTLIDAGLEKLKTFIDCGVLHCESNGFASLYIKLHSLTLAPRG